MKHRRIILVALVGFIAFVSGGWFFQGASSNDTRQRAQVFETVLRYVSEYYVDSVSTAQLYEMATEGMLDQLQDPYTSYLRQAGFEDLSISTTGDYGGVAGNPSPAGEDSLGPQNAVYIIGLRLGSDQDDRSTLLSDLGGPGGVEISLAHGSARRCPKASGQESMVGYGFISGTGIEPGHKYLG